MAQLKVNLKLLELLQCASLPAAVAGDELRAIATVMKIMSARAKLLGLEANREVSS